MPQRTELIFGVGTFIVKPGKEDEFLSAWKEFANWTSNQFKNARSGAYLMQDIDNPQMFMVTGTWNSLEDIKAWQARPEFQDWMKRERELCDHFEPHNMKLVAEVTNYPTKAEENENIKTRERIKQDK